MEYEDDILSVFHVAIPVSLLVTVTADFHVKWSVLYKHCTATGYMFTGLLKS